MRYLPFMQALRGNLLVAAEVLEGLGYSFDRTLNETPVLAPQIERFAVRDLLRDAGWPMPEALEAFYEVIGGIEFTGIAPPDWAGCDYPDPISMVPAELQYWRGELEMWNASCADDRDSLLHPVFYAQVAGDHIHKAGYSGGEYCLVFNGEDPLFDGEKISLPFTAYLRLCDAWGGFPGLRFSPHHTWPLDRIRAGFKPLPA